MRRFPPWAVAVALAIFWLGGMVVYLGMQAVPVGGLRGVVLAEETGRPLPGARVRLTAAFRSESYDFRTRRDGRFTARQIPAGLYQLRASTRAHSLGPVVMAVDEGVMRELTLELSPVPPFFELKAPWHTVTLDETPQVIVDGFITSQVVDFRFYRVEPEALFLNAGGSLDMLLRSEAPPRHEVIAGNPALTPAGHFSAPITRRDVEGMFRQRMDLSPLRGQPGIYLIAAQADSLQQFTWLTVTRLGLIVKTWGDDVLSYVVDLKTGQPIPGASIHLSLPSDGGAVGGASRGSHARGQTDQDGIFQARLPGGPQEERTLFARADKDGSSAFLRVYTYRGEDEGQTRVYAYTDRPVYRPGHLVYFKGIARSFTGDSYTVLAGKPVQVQAWDPRDTLVYKGALTTDQFGGFDSQLRLNDEAATGLYRLVSTIDGQPHESYFKVAEYRKPEYAVDVKTAKKRYVRGERVEADLSAEYYFGAPVAGAEVHYSVYRAPYYAYPEDAADGEEGYDDSDGGYYLGEMIQEGSTKTDERGVAHLSIPTTSASERRLERAGEVEESGDSRYTIEATVTDPGRREVSAQGSTIVTQGEFTLRVQATKFIVSPGEEAVFGIVAVDYDERPVPNVRVAMTAGEEIWSRAESRLEGASSATLTTDGEGKAVFRFKPRQDGFYRIEASASDRRGNRIRRTGYLWVTSGEYSDLGMPYPEMEVVPDRKQYRTGDTATFLINSKFKGATALVTIEGPRLYEHRLVTLKGGSTRVSVPMKQEYGPNFFFAVALIQDKRFASQEKRVKVSVEERQLQVTVKPDKERYTPGEQATYQVATADWEGRPVQAEVSVGVVDESIYAIQEEMAEPILRFFYPPRYNSVETSYSFYQIYLDADKEPVNIQVRKRFPDTAYWNPRLITGPDGRGQVSFAMRDTLTTWRATARGITMDTAVGEAVAKVKCSKDLLVRLETPRFMTQKDQLTLSAIAHNYTRAKQALSMWLTAPGLRFLARGSKEKRRFGLAADGVERQDWQVQAPAPGDQEVTAYLQTESGLSDGVQVSLPVIPHGRERVEWRSGRVIGTASERLPVRQDAVAGASDLRVRLSPSLASVILGALDYLASYPYGCAEQTMSSFLPDVVVARTLRELKLPHAQLEKKLPDMVQAGLNRLYGYQHGDGGWGWWRYDKSDRWMTAYVVFGLLTAKENGFSVNENFLNSGLHWLAQSAGSGTPQQAQTAHTAHQRIYPLYVLAVGGKGGAADEALTWIYRNANSLDSYTLALLTSALLERGRQAQARVAADRLWKKATQTQAVLYWQGSGDEGKGGATETTAVAFKALYSLSPGDPRLFKVVRWLVLNREGNHWVSTRDTAFVLYALTEFLKQSQELQPDYRAAVSLNGTQIMSRHVTQADLFAPEVEVKAPAGSLSVGENALTISKQGRGNLYYTLILRQFVGQEDMTELVTGAGISVNRRYHRVQSSRNPRTGVIMTAPAPRPTLEFASGESVLVRLTISTPKEYEYVIVEDPIPAGCEVAEQGGYTPYEWDRWWSDMEVRDEKVAIFARRLPRGVSVIEYHLRPQIPGDYHVMPTEVYSMYNPDLRGSGAEARVRLR